MQEPFHPYTRSPARHQLHALLISQPTILELIIAGTIVCYLAHAAARAENVLRKRNELK